MIQFNLDTAEASSSSAPFSVSVIGVGGSGTNVIDKMALEGVSGADLVSMNCDARALNTSMAGTKLQLGKSLTQGLGCGGDPELGGEAATASHNEIRELLTGRSMVFLCVGLGGGTGSGAAPVIARMAREAGAFVVVFATLPFAFEGRRRTKQAALALQDLRKYANALVTFENDRMGELVVPKKGVQEAFELADKIIGQSVRAVTSLVTQPGLIHIGMDDLITALRNTDSRCLFGFGQAKGENRAVEALSQALKSPLIDRGQMLAGARNVLVHICGGTSLTLFEIETLMRELGKHVHEDAQILFGAATDTRLAENLSVTVLTSLTRPAPAIEAEPAAAAVTPSQPTAPAPAPAAAPAHAGIALPPAQPAPRAIAAAQPAPEPIAPIAVAAAPTPAPAPAPVRPAVAAATQAMAMPAPTAAPTYEVVDADLFPESELAPAPAPEPIMIEVPAVRKAAPVRPIPAAQAPAPAPVPAPVFHEEPEAIYEDGEPTQLETHYQDESADSHAEIHAESADDDQIHYQIDETVEQYEEIAAELPEPEPELEPEPEPAPVAPPVPQRVIRIERLPAPVQRQAPAPQRPAATPAARQPETAPASRRFVLTDIIRRDAKPAATPPAPAPLPEAPMQYEPEEEFEEPAAPVRPTPAPAPAARRAPDFDRVTPIRPIPAGRQATPAPAASPFTATKPGTRASAKSTAPVPARTSVPTQQQTFDERLQPATTGSRFERTKPTVEEGEDLDVPTFLRRKR